MTSQTTHPREDHAAQAVRERILARRRNALVVLGGLVVVTMLLAILTGSVLVLVVSLVADVALAAYIAYLLQIKQQSQFQARHR